MEILKVRGKTSLLVLTASFIVLVLALSGCFLLPAPSVHFTAPSSINVSAYPIDQPITFKWVGSQENLKYTLSISKAGSTPVTVLLNNSALTSFATSIATPGDYTAKIVAKDNMGKEGENTVNFNVSSLEVLSTPTIYGVNTVSVNWKSLDGQPHTYLYTLGATWTTTTATNVTFSNLPDGNYTFQVKIKDSYVPAAVYKFQILTAGPTLYVAVSDRTAGEFYGMGSHPQGRFADISWTSDQGKLLDSIYVKFYKYVKDPTTGLYVRRRLAIDPTTDTWEMLPETATFGDQPFYVIDATEYNDMVVSATGHSSIPVYDFASGHYIYVPSFELGSPYSIIWFPVNSLGNMGGNTWALFTLSERYSNNDIPQMYVSYDKTTVATGATFTAYVKVPNVTAYASGSHQIINDPVDHTDITSNNGLMYTQFSLAIAPGLKIDKVTFPDMETGKVNLSNYTYNATSGVLTVYRGFVDPTVSAAPSTSATDIAVEIECTVPSTYTGSLAYVGLIYEGNFGAEGYSNLNPVFKDNSNKIIDGIVTVPAISGISVASSQSM